MKSWANETNSKIDSEIKNFREKDIRFFRVEEFKRNISRVGEFSAHCPYCEKQKQEIASMVEKMNKAINIPGQDRRDYDRLIGQLSSHMQKEHGFFTPWYFTYLFSFFGMVAGVLLGYILQKVIPTYNWEMLSLGFISGLLIGYFWGIAKDRRIRMDKKLM